MTSYVDLAEATLAIRALAPVDGLAAVEALRAERLRAERDEAKRLMEMRHREMLAADELMRKHQLRADKAIADRDRLAASEKELSDAYLRIRSKLDAWDTKPGGDDRFEVTEAVLDRLAAANNALEDKVARLVEAAVALRHAVCGETGFAACVRADSGRAYPWPALDEAEALVNAALAQANPAAKGEPE